MPIFLLFYSLTLEYKPWGCMGKLAMYCNSGVVSVMHCWMSGIISCSCSKAQSLAPVNTCSAQSTGWMCSSASSAWTNVYKWLIIIQVNFFRKEMEKFLKKISNFKFPVSCLVANQSSASYSLTHENCTYIQYFICCEWEKKYSRR